MLAHCIVEKSFISVAEAKRSSIKSNQFPGGIKEQTSTTLLQEPISAISDVTSVEMGPRIDQFQDFETVSQPRTNSSGNFTVCLETAGKDLIPPTENSDLETFTVSNGQIDGNTKIINGFAETVNGNVADVEDDKSLVVEESEQQSDEDDKTKGSTAIAQRDPVVLPDPLPRYISKIEKPTGKWKAHHANYSSRFSA